MRGAAKELVEKSEETGNGKDIISILLRANKSENPKTKLSDREVVDQVCESHAPSLRAAFLSSMVHE